MFKGKEDNEFVQWLENEIWKRRLTYAELSRRGGISPARISQVLAAGEPPGWQFVAAMARALDKDLAVVAKKAGLWEDGPSGPEIETKEYADLFRELAADQRRYILLTMQSWAADNARTEGRGEAQVPNTAAQTE